MVFSCFIFFCTQLYANTIQYPALRAMAHGDVLTSSEYSVPLFINNAKKILYYQYMAEGNKGLVTASSLILLPDKPNNKLVVFAHGTTGVDKACGIDKIFPLFAHKGFINPLLKEGYTVIMPNYRGLGETNTTHLYLNAKEAGKDLLDATLAAMQIQKINIKTSVAFLGFSQGGHATLSATEMRENYFPQLNLVGSVQYSAPINLDEVMNDVLNKKVSTIAQYFLLPYLASAVVRSYSGIDYDDFFSSFATPKDSEKEFSCLPNLVEMVPISNKWTINPTDQGLKAAVAYYEKQSLPQKKTDTPLILIRGLKDSLVINRWAKEYVSRLCAAGDIVEEFVYDGGHVDEIGVPVAIEWIKKRFNREPPYNICTALIKKK